jgi:Tfp pilus assembly protein PilN
LIKINLVREGRAVRGAGAAPAAVSAASTPGASNLNNILIVGLLVLGVLAGLGYWYMLKRERDEKKQIAGERRVEAQKLEAIIKEVEDYQNRKIGLQKRIDLINQLKQNQKGPVRIMDQISRDLPDLVWLDRMEINAGKISLTGRALNPNAVALFVENVSKDAYFEEPQLGTLAQMSKEPVVYSFDMTFGFTYTPKAPPGTVPAPPATATTQTTTQ